MVPIIELRGAIPVGISMGLDVWYCYLLSVLGNLAPVPFIILFIRRVIEWLQSKSVWLDKLVSKKVDKTLKRKNTIYKSELLGLLLLVAIPLPGTGAWTGALLAALLDIRLKNAFPVITMGVIIAGIIVMTVTYGFSSLFS